ncbi:hypothetical protein F5Y17DRAFT_412671 [Xylariaceae sp. FL0594]|nr:hypothetical protein F5Y17DRAFT_412671 [Xylariaceae sp. FL0594]
MFELAEAKRVRRKDLYESDVGSSSGTEDEGKGKGIDREALLAKMSAHLSGLFDMSSFVPPAPAPAKTEAKAQAGPQPKADEESSSMTKPGPKSHHKSDGVDDDSSDDSDADSSAKVEKQERTVEEEEAFAFRLFRDEEPTHTVILTPEDDSLHNPSSSSGFVVPRRPISYYVSPPLTPEQEGAYRSASVSAEYLLQNARRRNKWGLEKPWRVVRVAAVKREGDKVEGVVVVVPTTTPATGDNEDKMEGVETSLKGGEESEASKKKKRPGKKHRIRARVKAKEALERAEAARKHALEKEQHIQEKKKRLNREKKLKRRQKEREKKAQAKGAGGVEGRDGDHGNVVGGGGSDDGGSSGGE